MHGGDRSIDRWIALEMGNLVKSHVPAARPLAELLQEDEPAATTRGGEKHPFDKAVLKRFHDALGPLARRRLRLPMTFYVDRELHADAYLTDETAVELLRALGDVPPQTQMRDGKLWMGHARARAIAERHPTAFQFVLH